MGSDLYIDRDPSEEEGTAKVTNKVIIKSNNQELQS